MDRSEQMHKQVYSYQSEQSLLGNYLEQLIDISEDIFLEIDNEGQIVFASAAAYNFAAEINRRCPQDLLGLSVYRVLALPSYFGDELRPMPEGKNRYESLDFLFSETMLLMRWRGKPDRMVEVYARRCLHKDGHYLLFVKPLDALSGLRSDEERLMFEMRRTNQHLRGTLNIISSNLNSTDINVLFDHVLTSLTNATTAQGALIYTAEPEGFRLVARNPELPAAVIPRYLPRGLGLATMASNSGHTLRLSVESKSRLREGSEGFTRRVRDIDSSQTREVFTRILPPFASILCVPVWFGDSVIAIIQLGWMCSHTTQKDDAYLLDVIAAYLSTQIMAAFKTLRAREEEKLEMLRKQLLNMITLESADAEVSSQQSNNDVMASPLEIHTDSQHFLRALDVLEEGLSCLSVPLYEDREEAPFVALIPDRGYVKAPRQIFPGFYDEKPPSALSAHVYEISELSALSAWLGDQNLPSTGYVVDLGVLAGRRRSFLALREENHPFDEMEQVFFHRVADMAREQVFKEELQIQNKRISQALQSGMRSQLQNVEGIDAKGVYLSATTEALVGGDFYDLIRLPEHKACLIVGDVAGKGVEAASVSTALRTALAAYATAGLGPSSMVAALNDFMLANSRDEIFATMFVGIIDLVDKELRYCSAGHPAALLIGENSDDIVRLNKQSGVVGAFENMSYSEGKIGIKELDTLILYTDGVLESRNPQADFFGYDGLLDSLTRYRNKSPQDMVEGILEDLEHFAAHKLKDDVAIVALKIESFYG